MNDLAASGLGVMAGLASMTPPDGIASGLRSMIADGVEVRDDVIVWAGGAWWATPPPGNYLDLTDWECSVNSFHLEDVSPSMS